QLVAAVLAVQRRLERVADRLRAEQRERARDERGAVGAARAPAPGELSRARVEALGQREPFAQAFGALVGADAEGGLRNDAVAQALVYGPCGDQLQVGQP